MGHADPGSRGKIRYEGLAMKEHEAEQVISALESGRRFEFSNYYVGVREVLELDQAEGRFLHTAYFAYEAGRDDRNVFTREEFAAHLRQNFSFRCFDLPSAAGPPAPKKGRGLSIHKPQEIGRPGHPGRAVLMGGTLVPRRDLQRQQPERTAGELEGAPRSGASGSSVS
jgi:hypothetical protein